MAAIKTQCIGFRCTNTFESLKLNLPGISIKLSKKSCEHRHTGMTV